MRSETGCDMDTQRAIRVKINCQKGKTVETELLLNGGYSEKDGIGVEITERDAGACRLAALRLTVESQTLVEGAYLAMETPVRAYVPLRERPEKITAIYMFSPWWTRPAFVGSPREIPDRTQLALFKFRDRITCFVPMVGSGFKTWINGGTEDALCLEMTAYAGGQSRIDEPLYLSADGATAAEAVRKAFACLIEEKGIRPREARRIPQMLRYLGWCSWDAFGTDVTESRLREKADELAQKQVPVRWMLIDDGWFDARDKYLHGFHPDKEKFPLGFKGMIEDIKQKGDIRWFGVWHALGGYWDGIAPESPLVSQEAPYLYHAVNGRIVPSPRTGSGFYDDWYQVLRREGIDFVKVDGQSIAPMYFANSMPVSEAASGLNRALESGAYRMDNAIINCMGMAMENVLARPVSAVSRNSDDFFPHREGSFREHLLQNAYNAIYHNEIYCCDWDMFWTTHPDAVKHSLLRAISGGPVYFSDRIGDTNRDVLKPLTYQDGEILMMDRSAKPTEDCVFRNPLEDGVLKLHNVGPWGTRQKGGGIAVYNLTAKRQTFSFTPADIPDLEKADRYWVYDYFAKKAVELARDGAYSGALEGEGFAWYVILPRTAPAACFGLLDKYAGFTAVESVRESENAQVVVLHHCGPLGWACDRPPRKVIADATDVTSDVRQSGKLYTLPLPERAQRTVLSVLW